MHHGNCPTSKYHGPGYPREIKEGSSWLLGLVMWITQNTLEAQCLAPQPLTMLALKIVIKGSHEGSYCWGQWLLASVLADPVLSESLSLQDSNAWAKKYPSHPTCHLTNHNSLWLTSTLHFSHFTDISQRLLGALWSRQHCLYVTQKTQQNRNLPKDMWWSAKSQTWKDPSLAPFMSCEYVMNIILFTGDSGKNGAATYSRADKTFLR